MIGDTIWNGRFWACGDDFSMRSWGPMSKWVDLKRFETQLAITRFNFCLQHLGPASTQFLLSPKRLWVATWSHQLVAPKWLTFKCFAWMVKVASWPSLLPPWAGKCGRWFWSNFRQRGGEDLHCSTLLHRLCLAKHCKSRALQVRTWRFPALMFLQVCVLHGAMPRAMSEELRKSLHWRVWLRC